MELTSSKMEAKNFRIGNWIRTHKEEQITDVLCDSINTHRHECLTYDNVGCIELNREWFQKYGFHESNGFWIDLNTTQYLEIISTIEDDGDRYYYPVYAQVPGGDEQRVSLNRIRYVHELQNLFFALTGRELEFVAETST